MKVTVKYESIISDTLKEYIKSIGEEDIALSNVQYMHFNTVSWLNGFMNECLEFDDVIFEVAPAKQNIGFTLIIKKQHHDDI